MKEVLISDFCDTGSGGTPSRARIADFYDNGTIPWVKSGELSSGEIFETEEHITEAALKESAAKLVKPGALLMAMYGATVGQVAKLGVSAATNQAVCYIVPDQKLCNIDYLNHFLRSIRGELLAQRVGGGQPNISQGIIKAISVPLPPLAEQKRIAAILDKADAIRRKLQQSLRLSDDFLRSVFLDMFGSDKSPKCERVPLSPFLEFMTSGGRGWSQYYAPSGARFIRSLDVQMNEIGEKDVAYVAAPNNAEAKRTRVRENDVLLTITGSLIGRVARVPKEHAGAYISQHVAILRLGKGLDPEFLARFLSMDEGQRLVQKSQYGQTKPGLNFDQIRRFTVPLPSATLQKRFVEIANRVNASSMKSRTFMSESETLFSSLQQRAFRGEL